MSQGFSQTHRIGPVDDDHNWRGLSGRWDVCFSLTRPVLTVRRRKTLTHPTCCLLFRIQSCLSDDARHAPNGSRFLRLPF